MRYLKLLVFFGLFPVLLSACQKIQGVEITGIWNASDDLGTMEIEVTPWQGAFVGYLLSYTDTEGNTTKGGKDDRFIVLTDLKFLGPGSYGDGNFTWGDGATEACTTQARFVTEDQLLVEYDCLGQKSAVKWYRKGTPVPGQDEEVTGEDTEGSTLTSESEETQATETKPGMSPRPASPNVDWPLQAAAVFYVVGKQKTVAFGDERQMAAATERLWTALYDNDFSGQLAELVDPSNVYLVYSNYNEAKETVQLTLGYQVNGLRNVPDGLVGVKVPANEFLVFPMSTNGSGERAEEGWEELENLLPYRQESSADFEVYSFDENFNITKAELWLASK